VTRSDSTRIASRRPLGWKAVDEDGSPDFVIMTLFTLVAVLVVFLVSLVLR